MNTSTDAKLTVYFDGLCHLCSREIDHYRRQNGSDQLRFVDITLPEFDAQTENLDPKLVHKVMHVKTQNQELKTGVEAFIAIWDHLPKYQWLSKLAKTSALRPFLDLGYQGFAAVRPYLPRKTNNCEQSPYCER